MKKLLSVLMIITLLLSMFGCAKNEESTASTKKEIVTISAAASLTEALTEIKGMYEEKTGTELTLNFGSSGSLQKQIEEGAPADVFLSASKDKMDKLEEKDLIHKDSRSNLLKNSLVLIVSEEYKDKIKNLSDIINMDVKISLGETESVPAGKYGKQAIDYYKLWDGLADKIVYAKDVKQVAQYVESGEAAAGIVYNSDAKILKNSYVNQVFEESSHKPIVYPMAIVKNSKNTETAKKFMEYLKAEEAQEIFVKYGFESFK